MSAQNEKEVKLSGSASMSDGTRRHLTHEECAALLAAADAAKAARASAMPTEQDALRIMWEAYRRLHELGWREAMYCPKDGTPFQVIEAGSTGIFHCHYHGSWPNGWWISEAGDLWPSHPILWRPIP